MGKIARYITKIFVFFNEVVVELKKSSWPPRAELLQSTLVVILSVVALGIIVGVSDFVLMRLLRSIL